MNKLTDLEALESIVVDLTPIAKEQNKEKIKQIKKSLEAFEIIKNKRINLEYIKSCKTYEQYKTICSYWNEITQEEFDLLKKVFL